MEFALELVIKAAKLGARVDEIPVTLWPDKRGRRPHLRTFHDGWRSLRFMLLYAPNWLFLLPGISLLLSGLGLVFWLFPGPRRLGHVTFDVHTMLFGMIFALLGTQVMTIGLFAKVFSYSDASPNNTPLNDGCTGSNSSTAFSSEEFLLSSVQEARAGCCGSGPPAASALLTKCAR